jgi:hypothetical protein
MSGGAVRPFMGFTEAQGPAVRPAEPVRQDGGTGRRISGTRTGT